MPHRKHKHLLLLRFSAMGDVAITVPVVRALVQQHPNVKVTVASRAEYMPFFDGIPNVNFYEANFKKAHKGFFGLLKLYRALRHLHIYAVADLHNVMRSKVITFLFSIRGKKTATTNKMRSERAALTALKDKQINPLPQVTQLHADVLAQLGFPIDLSKVVFPEPFTLPEDVTRTTGTKEGNWIGIAPFAQHSGKVYPKDLIQQVINTLADNPENKLFLFGGGRHEARILKEYAGNRPNIVVLAGGVLILKQELKVISNLNVMLSMDSANAHMAAMLGIKAITLWGATHPYAGFAPFNQPADFALTANRDQYPMLPTSIYGNKKVEGYEDAMRTISPESVVAKINEVLELE
ncbi:ADP-heptose--LPS heptosyltransferase RfaF [Flavobacterium sp. Sd200]|uniref:glycosyltransferase family 9 protein n=1 Tax=Flavobacterium sp. Sd200 TaxID=2692211 RepID=UPI00136B9908|nr:glycosyltransferase family 9 protein [Flavobacterium sp. Sd200]MXN92590.1 ADP-heptose--LPS heptosyltransferase RfaF [Flavobacterium sp. Sd200]